MDDNYIPYGTEWEKEMMKLPKKFLINMIKIAQIKLHLAEESIKAGEDSTISDKL